MPYLKKHILINIAFFFILSIIFSSCNKNEKSKIIIQAKTKEEIRQDSIRNQEELIVFGNIKFGMNLADFEISKKEFEEKCRGEFGVKFIGDYQFYSIYGYFHDEKLYYVEIKGKPLSYKSYERFMPLQYEALISILKNKYGTPYPENRLPEWHLLSEGKQYYLAEWYNLGDKKINMFIECKELDYRLNIEIYKPSITEIIHNEREAEKKNAIKKGVEVL